MPPAPNAADLPSQHAARPVLRRNGRVVWVALLGLTGVLALQQWTEREALLRQLGRHNHDSVQWLVRVLEVDAERTADFMLERVPTDTPIDAEVGAPRRLPPAASARRDERLASAFERSGLQRLQLLDRGGRVLWQRSAAAAPTRAPAGYARLLALHAEPGVATLRRTPQRDAPWQLRLEVRTAEAVDALWQGLLLSASALALLAGAALLTWRRRQRRLRRAIGALVAQADAVLDPHPAVPLAPELPELRLLAHDIDRLVERLRRAFDAQAGQLQALHRQLHIDALTGLPQRCEFVARLGQALAGEQAPPQLGLLLLRVRDLQGMNRRIGHLATDHALQAVAHTLASYPQRADGCFAGRLNGADFALMLPTGGVALETADALVRGLRLPLATVDAACGIAVGAVELCTPMPLEQALARADEALARAEAECGFAAAGPLEAAPRAAFGAADWRRRIADALAHGRAELGAYPVRGADGRVLHLDCPLRLQLDVTAGFAPAAQWMAPAARNRQCAELDLRAAQLALTAIARDDQPRCINFSAQALADSDFMAAVSRLLEAAPQAATRLWIDLPEALALEHPMRVRDAARRWRPLGVYLGLEHVGQGLGRAHRLADLGIDCVRVDARFVQALAGSGAGDARAYLAGLVRLAQGAGLQISAEGVSSAADLDVLWVLGFDAASGPAVAGEIAPADTGAGRQPTSAQCSV